MAQHDPHHHGTSNISSLMYLLNWNLSRDYQTWQKPFSVTTGPRPLWMARVSQMNKWRWSRFSGPNEQWRIDRSGQRIWPVETSLHLCQVPRGPEMIRSEAACLIAGGEEWSRVETVGAINYWKRVSVFCYISQQLVTVVATSPWRQKGLIWRIMLDSPAAVSGDVIGRPVKPADDTGQAREWLDICQSQHSCLSASRAAKAILPTRILDINKHSLSESIVLVESKIQKRKICCFEPSMGVVRASRRQRSPIWQVTCRTSRINSFVQPSEMR